VASLVAAEEVVASLVAAGVAVASLVAAEVAVASPAEQAVGASGLALVLGGVKVPCCLDQAVYGREQRVLAAMPFALLRVKQ